MKWIAVKDKVPDTGVMVLAYFKNEYNNHRRIRAMYVPAKTIEDEGEEEFYEYDEEAETYYLPEGWYEQNEFEETHWCVHGEVTHWMPLPEPPA